MNSEESLRNTKQLLKISELLFGEDAEKNTEELGKSLINEGVK